MSYSVTITLSPHHDAAKTVAVYLRNACGLETFSGYLHEYRPEVTVSVPPGHILIIADNAIAGKL